jgi:hypothetical protein
MRSVADLSRSARLTAAVVSAPTRTLTVRREPLWMRLGSFVLALASHKVTALAVAGAGCWAVVYYMAIWQVWP